MNGTEASDGQAPPGNDRSSSDRGPVPVTRERPLGLSPLQEGMWLDCQLAPESRVYHLKFAVDLSGPVDDEALVESLRTIVRRHEILRTAFRTTGEGPVQVVSAEPNVEVERLDLRGAPGAAVGERFVAFTTARYDLENGPLVRFALVRLDEGKALWLGAHHLVFDGASFGILFRELEAIYPVLAAGRTPDLPALRLQYVDIAAWQRERLAKVLPRQLAFWRDRLPERWDRAGLVPSHAPQARTPRRGALRPFVIASAPTAQARRFATSARASLFATLLAAFEALLFRWNGERDQIVGTAVNLRVPADSRRMVGLFANMILVRAEVSGELSFNALVSRVQDGVFAAFAHADAPLGVVVRDVEGPRRSSTLPSVRISFALDSAVPEELALGPVVGRPVFKTAPGHPFEAQFELAVRLQEAKDSLIGRVMYDADRYAPETMDLLASAYERVLVAALAAPDQPIDTLDLQLLGDADRRRVLVDWNDTGADYPRDSCVHELFAEQAARTPDAVAIVLGDRQLTYGELDARANQLSRHLVALGVGPEVPVAICAARSIESVVGVIAILKAGGAYVPLDPDHPPARLAFIVADTRAAVLLTVGDTSGPPPAWGGRVVALDRDWPSIAGLPTTPLPRRARADAAAYVMYTSGSTGKPKGVIAIHRGITRLVCNTDYVSLAASDRVAHVANPAFDAATFEIWAPLTSGACLVIVPRETVIDLPLLAEALRRGGVTVAFLTTALFNEVVRTLPRALSCLEQLLVGGEAADPGRIGELLAAGGRGRLSNVYGPTETTTFATFHRVESVGRARAIPIGRPIANSTAYVLDRDLRPVPVGAPGELFLGGDGLARGYRSLASLSAERFVPDPFSARPGARMYRTGDRARHLADGSIDFLGRFDDQVKIRGFRIEPGETASVLSEHASVRQVVVLTREDSPGDRRLVAYVVPADPSEDDLEALRAFAKGRLPYYMQPAAYVRVASLPRTANGKIDRRALPPPAVDGGPPYESPTEVMLLQIWEGLLPARPISLVANFFEIGGSSLLAARMMLEIERAFGRRLPLSILFERSTIRELARTLIRQDPERASPVTAFHADGSERCFFFLHGDYTGGGLYCRHLARELGPDQPFYAVHPAGLDGPVVHASIEEMAVTHLATLRSIQPVGPYRLGGHCNGGLIAFEIARRLHAEGGRVELLVMIDARAGHRSSGAPASANAPTSLEDVYRHAVSMYTPERFTGCLTLVDSSEGASHARAWQGLAAQSRVYHLPGHHLELLTRNVRVLASCLRHAIRQLEPGDAPAVAGRCETSR